MRPIDQEVFQRFQTLTKAYWQALDMAVQQNSDKELRQEPRGGGRDVTGIVRHLLDSDAGYLSALGRRLKKSPEIELDEERDLTRQAVLNALAAAMHGERPERGPRGGMIWKPRYFVRRLAWHVLDHVWEIENRVM
ncbi:MAG: hypothetical protein GFH27_549281n222 [Chloroflexi bacterium AL-W]|nr:hypothetical protein [Chloroflexi bacterium AL-N1]NOK66108.1 hypothetical protein [Chloroflexi bacterium AL-N10]NOK72989.1 hypothetical protein [Chloroflexi bacterium AL-N5]NOK79886.1 hypothetical protein [Chloroflexi bacterium AL-W]NOK88258.1 hypothetical protein [Chloroflexi bacterium AL-N15]